MHILRPAWYVKGVLLLLSSILLYEIFLIQIEHTLPAYGCYAISAYTLLLYVMEIPDAYRHMRCLLEKNRYTRRYLKEAMYRSKVSLYTGLMINCGYAVYKLYAGYHYQSLWLSAIALYYVILSVTRFMLIKEEKKITKPDETGTARIHGLKSYRYCGWLMLLLNVAISIIAAQMIWQGKTYVYPGTLIYASATYTFYCLITAIINIIRYRKMEHPVLSAAKMLSFAGALMSILALQTAMLTQFGNQTSNQKLMNAMTAFAVCMSIFCIAIYMIRKADLAIKEEKEVS